MIIWVTRHFITSDRLQFINSLNNEQQQKLKDAHDWIRIREIISKRQMQSELKYRLIRQVSSDELISSSNHSSVHVRPTAQLFQDNIQQNDYSSNTLCLSQLTDWPQFRFDWSFAGMTSGSFTVGGRGRSKQLIEEEEEGEGDY